MTTRGDAVSETVGLRVLTAALPSDGRVLLGFGAEAERLQAEIDAMKATRVWRLGTRYWSLRDRVRGSKP